MLRCPEMTHCSHRGFAPDALPNIATDQPVAKSTEDIFLIGLGSNPENVEVDRNRRRAIAAPARDGASQGRQEPDERHVTF
jgi:hypothetical protein